MRTFEINCVRRAPGLQGHEAITHIGHHGKDWCLTSGAAIKRIDAAFEAYYILDPQTGERAYLGVVREPGQPPYLRAHINGHWNDGLLGLGDMGETCVELQ